MLFRSDIYKVIKEAINPRLNTDSKPLNQLIGNESQSIKDYFLIKLNEKININPNKSLDQVIKENTEQIIIKRVNDHPTASLNYFIPQRNRKAFFNHNAAWAVPSGVFSIRVTACAAGGRGGNGSDAISVDSLDYGGGGGGGGSAGQYILSHPFKVNEGQIINITTGYGNTVIPELGINLLKGNPGGDATPPSRISERSRGGNGGHTSYCHHNFSSVPGAGGGGGGGGIYRGWSDANARRGSTGGGGGNNTYLNFINASNGEYNEHRLSGSAGWMTANSSLGGQSVMPDHLEISCGGGGGGGGGSIFHKGGNGGSATLSGAGSYGESGGFGAGGGGGSGGTFNASNNSNWIVGKGTPGGEGGQGIVIIEW
ncbi:MAG: hypothetical protein ACRDA4_00195 [Filifactoraceae bacterium]